MSYIKIETANAARELEQKLSVFFPAQSRKVISRVINKTLGVANTQANRAIMAKYNLKLRDLNDPKSKKIERSNTISLTGNIKANISPLSLSKFNPVWTRDNSQKFGSRASFLIQSKGNQSIKNPNSGEMGVTVEIVKGQKQTLRSAFMLFKYSSSGISSGLVFARGIYGDNGFRFGVYQRLPITKLNTKSVFYTMFNNDVERAIYNKIVNYYPKELDRLYTLLSKESNVFNPDSK